MLRWRDRQQEQRERVRKIIFAAVLFAVCLLAYHLVYTRDDSAAVEIAADGEGSAANANAKEHTVLETIEDEALKEASQVWFPIEEEIEEGARVVEDVVEQFMEERMTGSVGERWHEVAMEDLPYCDFDIHALPDLGETFVQMEAHIKEVGQWFYDGRDYLREQKRDCAIHVKATLEQVGDAELFLKRGAPPKDSDFDAEGVAVPQDKTITAIGLLENDDESFVWYLGLKGYRADATVQVELIHLCDVDVEGTPDDLGHIRKRDRVWLDPGNIVPSYADSSGSRISEIVGLWGNAVTTQCSFTSDFHPTTIKPLNSHCEKDLHSSIEEGGILVMFCPTGYEALYFPGVEEVPKTINLDDNSGVLRYTEPVHIETMSVATFCVNKKTKSTIADIHLHGVTDIELHAEKIVSFATHEKLEMREKSFQVSTTIFNGFNHRSFLKQMPATARFLESLEKRTDGKFLTFQFLRFQPARDPLTALWCGGNNPSHNLCMWKRYKEGGYLTQLVSTSCPTSPVPWWYEKGQADLSVWRPLCAASKTGCAGTKFRHQHALALNYQISRDYDDVGEFLVTELSNDSLQAPMDEDYAAHLHSLLALEESDRTFYFVMGGVGEAGAKDPNPFLYLVVSREILDAYPQLENNLRANRDKIIGPKDVHATWLHLLQLNSSLATPEGTTGRSLLGEISSRSCVEAGVDERHCSC